MRYFVKVSGLLGFGEDIISTLLPKIKSVAGVVGKVPGVGMADDAARFAFMKPSTSALKNISGGIPSSNLGG